MQVMDKVKSAAGRIASTYKAGDAQSSTLPSELKTAGESMRNAATALGKGESTTEPKGTAEKPAQTDKTNTQGPYGSRPGEKRIDTTDMTKPLYDKGGKVNVNDGKHQVAILKQGERVLTPKQTKDYEDQVKNRPGVKQPVPEKLRNEPMKIQMPSGKIDGHMLDDAAAASQAVFDEGGKVMEHSPSEKAHFARSMHKLHGGALHRHFGIPEDQPIPMEKKQEAANSDNPHVAAMGRMAVAMHGWSHKSKK